MCENVLNPWKPEGKFRLCFSGAVNCVLQRKTRKESQRFTRGQLDTCM